MAFKTGDQLATIVLGKLQDDSYEASDVLDKFNTCLKELAGNFLLPELETDEAVTTNTSLSYMSLPSSYHRNLFKCYSTTNSRWITVYKGLRLMLGCFSVPDRSGSVVGVVAKGRSLYYQRIPSSEESLKLFFYKLPTVLTLKTTPSELPEHLAEKLLVNYALADLFAEIEDGSEGNKVNTAFYQGKYEQAKAELAVFLGEEQKEPEGIPDELDLEAYL